MKHEMGLVLKSSVALRIWCTMAVLALLLLWSGGGSFLDGFRLLIGILSVGEDGEGSLRFLFWRIARSFMVMALALVGGVSAAFTLSLFVSFCSDFANRITRVLGRFLSYIPLMGVCLLVIYACIEQWDLPIESMLPFEVKSLSETWMNKWGRDVWAWMLPVLLLSIPVFGKGLEVFGTHLLGITQQPLMLGLKARGVTRWDRVFLHLFAMSMEKVRGLLVLLAPFVLMGTVIVEEALRYKGWGAFGATAFREGNAVRLAAFVYAGGFILAIWLSLMEWLERRYPLPAPSSHENEFRVNSNVIWAGMGSLMGLAGVLLLCFWERLFPESNGLFSQVYAILGVEVYQAFLGAVCSTLWALGLAVVFFVTSKKWYDLLAEIFRIGRFFPFMLTGICLLWVFEFHSVLGTLMLSLLLVSPAGHALWKEVNDYKLSTRYSVSFGFGVKPQHLFLRVVLPAILPSLIRVFFYAFSTWLMWQCFISYLGGGSLLHGSSGHLALGSLIYQQSDLVFDQYLNLLPPSLMIATLCFTSLYLGECLSEITKTTQPVSKDGERNTF